MSNQNHIPVIISLRGLAATSVCFYHFICTTTGFIENKTVLTIFKNGQYGVSLFFIISGIVIPLSMINGAYTLSKWRQFILKRIMRIEPPYIVAVLIGIFYLFIRNFIPGSAEVDLTPTTFNVVLHLGYLIPFFENQQWISPVFWTLAIEFQYYLTISLLLPLVLKNQLLLRITFYILFLIPPFFFSQSLFFPAWSAYFLFGIIYALVFKKLIGKYEYFTVSVLTLFVIFYQLGLINGTIAIVTIMVIHFFRNHSSKIGDFVGNISYSLYLLHSIVGAAFVNFFSHRVDAPWEKIIVVLCGFLVSVLSAYLMYRLVEKPSQIYARKFFS